MSLALGDKPVRNTTFVLWCGRCNKPFNKESSLKRHGYYCRSRSVIPATRISSCVSCVRSKARCDHKRPRCSRCVTRNTSCCYPSSVAARTGVLSSPFHDPSPVELVADQTFSTPATATYMPTIIDNTDDVNMLLGGIVAPLGEDLMGLMSDSELWDQESSTLNDFVHSGVHDLSLLSPRAPSLATVSAMSIDAPPRKPLTSPASRAEKLHQSPVCRASSIPIAPTSIVRSLVRRPSLQCGNAQVIELIFSTLKSYPLMLRQDRTPPFIHATLVGQDSDDIAMAPLHNCVNLMHMINGRRQGSQRLFWENVRRECDMFTNLHAVYTSQELLAAMLALTVYVLTRLEEGETEHNNLDSLLVRAVILVALQLAQSSDTGGRCALRHFKSAGGWQDFVFEESRRRLAVVYRVINKLMYFEPASLCDLPADLMIAPLPATRYLWEAESNAIYETEVQKGPNQVAYGLAANGAIVKLNQDRSLCTDAWLPVLPLSENGHQPRGLKNDRSNCWQEWCSGIDSFGGLVMLATALTA